MQLTKHQQQSAYHSPWAFHHRLGFLAWNCVWTIFCMWTPKPLNSWRLLWLRLFGATLHGKPFVHQRARIQIPWNLEMHDRACLGDRAQIYSLDKIEIGARATVAQEAYLCGGTHDFEDSKLSLMTGKITLEEDSFVGARAFVMPGLYIGAGAIVGACSVVTSDVEDWSIVAGNPAKKIGSRNRPERN